MKNSYLLITALLVILCFSDFYSQDIGILYTKNEADIKYGSVLESVELTKSQMESLLRKTSDCMMFRIVKGELIILGDNRNLLTSSGSFVKESDVYYMFSKSKVIELMKMGGERSLFVEQRETRLTVTCGKVTLEEAIFCPPFCE